MKRKELSLCEVHELFTEKTFTWSVFRSRTNIETSTPDLPNAFASRFAATAAPPVNSEVFIIKRDGKKETFSLDKIKNAIAKAFLSVGSFATQDVITTVLSRVSVSDGMNVEEIQNQVEVALMAEHYYSVAKAYMLYRQKHLEDREVRDKLKFLLDYCDASNPATGSKYDANANVENKNIATLIGELPKSNFIRLNRRLLTDRLKDMYGKE